MIEFPSTLQELFASLVTSVVFLGTISALLTGALWRTGWNPPENWKRFVSLAVPFVIAFLAFFGQLIFGYVDTWDENTIYSIILVGIGAGFGKQLAYTGYQAVKSAVNGSKNPPKAL